MNDTLYITQELVGKYVRLRDGSKGYISGILPPEICKNDNYDSVYCVSGAYLDQDEWEMGESWTADGTSYVDEEDPKDIVGLWVDTSTIKDDLTDRLNTALCAIKADISRLDAKFSRFDADIYDASQEAHHATMAIMGLHARLCMLEPKALQMSGDPLKDLEIK